MRLVELENGHICQWYVPYLVNSDSSGMEEWEIRTVNKWYDAIQKRHPNVSLYIDYIVDDDHEPYFGRDAVSGLMAEVVDYTVYATYPN